MPSSLAERRSLSQAPAVASAVVTAQDIIVGGGVYEIDFNAAQSVVLYVGFPVVVQLDDSELSVPKIITKRGVGGEAYTLTASGHYRIARPVRRLRFLLPAGFGAGGEAETYARHASILVFAGNPDIEPLAVDPDMLPTHTARVTAAIPGSTTTAAVVLGDTVWNVGNATPHTIWLKSVSWARVAATGSALGTIYEWNLVKTNTPAGDTETLLGFTNAAASVLGFTGLSLPNIQICLKACLDQYAVGAGDIGVTTIHDTNVSASTLVLHFCYSYML